VLLLDGRWDGLPLEAEDLIADNLGRAGLNIDLDAISDPSCTLRVLEVRPEALDGYDAVIAVSPLRTDWRGSARVLARIVDRISARMPTLLIDQLRGSDVSAEEPPADGRPGRTVGTVLLPAGIEPVGAAEQIAGALRDLLQRFEAERPAAPILVGGPPTTAALIRDDIGALAAARLDWIARVARDASGLAFAAVNLLRADSITTIASSGPLPGDHPVQDSLTAIALRTTGITVMPDTWLDPDAYARSPTQGPGAVRFYAAWPLRSGSGELIGTLCISDTSPHRAEEFDFTTLQDLALLTEGELIHAQRHPEP
jgi:hypothetical protein